MANAFEKLHRFIKENRIHKIIKKWWADEGEKVFASSGGRIGAGSEWRASKKGAPYNVDTGRLRNAIIQRSGNRDTIGHTFSRRTEDLFIISYDRRAFMAIQAKRPVVATTTVQMAALDAMIQQGLDGLG